MVTAFLIALAVPIQPQVSVGVDVQVRVPAPVVHFEVEPALVTVSPGVMVVHDYHREVFFVNGHYWTYSDGVWFRARSHRGGWVAVPRYRVPVRVARIPHGKYRYYKRGRPHVRHHRAHRGKVRGHGGRGHRVMYKGKARGGGRGHHRGDRKRRRH